MPANRKIEKVTAGNLVTAVIFLFLFIITLTALYLRLTKQHLPYISEVIRNWQFYVPPSLLETAQTGSFKGLWLILGLQSVHLAGYLLVSLGIGGFLSRWYFQRRLAQLTPPALKVQPIAEFNPLRRRMQVLIFKKGEYFASNLYPEHYIRLTRAQVKPKRPPQTPLEHFELALYSILKAHQHWSCDPEGHHADVGLLEHSMNVAQNLRDKLKHEPLTRVIGMAHDIGKILAYEQVNQGTEKIWVKKTRNHEQLSAQLIRMLPEFRNLDEANRTIVNSVLSFMHHPERMPKSMADERTFKLIKYLRIADGFTTRNEQLDAELNAQRNDIIQAIADVIPQLISGANINGKIAGHANGWTNPLYDFVAILENHMRVNLKGLIPYDMEEALSLSMDLKPGKTHPATIAIYNALVQRELIFQEYGGATPPNGLFSVRSGTQAFHGAFLLKRDVLEGLIHEKLEAWGKSPYKIKIFTRY